MQALEPGVDIREQRAPDGSLVLSVSGALDERAAQVVAQRITDSTSPLWALVLELHGSPRRGCAAGSPGSRAAADARCARAGSPRIDFATRLD
jgi:hypothetical protein